MDETTRLFKNDEVIKGAEIIEEIVQKCVSELGTLGSKLKFNKELYDQLMSKFDPYGSGQLSYQLLKILVVSLVTYRPNDQ